MSNGVEVAGDQGMERGWIGAAKDVLGGDELVWVDGHGQLGRRAIGDAYPWFGGPAGASRVAIPLNDGRLLTASPNVKVTGWRPIADKEGTE